MAEGQEETGEIEVAGRRRRCWSGRKRGKKEQWDQGEVNEKMQKGQKMSRCLKKTLEK